MKFAILHHLALMSSKLSSRLKALAIRESVARAVWLREKAMNEDRLRRLAGSLSI